MDETSNSLKFYLISRVNKLIRTPDSVLTKMVLRLFSFRECKRADSITSLKLKNQFRVWITNFKLFQFGEEERVLEWEIEGTYNLEQFVTKSVTTGNLPKVKVVRVVSTLFRRKQIGPQSGTAEDDSSNQRS